MWEWWSLIDKIAFVAAAAEKPLSLFSAAPQSNRLDGAFIKSESQLASCRLLVFPLSMRLFFIVIHRIGPRMGCRRRRDYRIESWQCIEATGWLSWRDCTTVPQSPTLHPGS